MINTIVFFCYLSTVLFRTWPGCFYKQLPGDFSFYRAAKNSLPIGSTRLWWAIFIDKFVAGQKNITLLDNAPEKTEQLTLFQIANVLH